MSGPPPGYNPLESTLQGGTNAPIAPVQGGGGGVLQTNPDQSLLSGGNNAPIHGVQGGGAGGETIAGVTFPVSVEFNNASSYEWFLYKELKDDGIINEDGTLNEINNKEERINSAIEKARAAKVEYDESAKTTSTGVATSNQGQNQTAETTTGTTPTTRSEATKTIPPNKIVGENGELHNIVPSVQTGENGVKHATIQATITPPPATTTPPQLPSDIGLKQITISKEVQADPPQLKDGELDLLKAKIPGYLGKRRPLWKIIDLEGRENTSQPPVFFEKKNCTDAIKNNRGDDTKGQGGFYRLAVFLKESTQTILQLPAVNGKWLNYASCKAHIQSRLQNKNDVFIFSSPFYGNNPVTNMRLFLDVIGLMQDSKAAIYVPAQHTNFNFSTGCQIQDALYGANTSPGPQLPILNLLEPTYIIYPFRRSLQGNTKEGIIFTAAAPQGEVPVPASKVSSKKASIGLALKKIGARDLKSICFPPELSLRDSIIDESPTKWEIIPLADSSSKGETLIANEYRFYGDKQLTFSDETIELYKFVGADPKRLDKGNLRFVPIDLGGKVHSIRSGSDEGVREDWENGLFTESEAEFLNDLNLRPQMMKDIFGEGGGKELDKFLYSLTMSECFKTTMFLSHRQCEGARKFVNKVYAYFLSNSASISGLTDKEKEDIEGELRERADKADVLVRDALKHNEVTIGTLLDELGKVKRAYGAKAEKTADEITEALVKDPIKEGILKNGDPSTLPLGTKQVFPSADVKSGNKYTMYVLVLKKDGTFEHAALETTEAKDTKEAERILHEKFDKLREDYPGYTFVA